MWQGWQVGAGEVISFVAASRRERRPEREVRERPENGRGTVLLFTGVRYERVAETAPPAPRPPGGHEGVAMTGA